MESKVGENKQKFLIWGLVVLAVILIGVVVGLVITIGVNNKDEGKEKDKGNKTTTVANDKNVNNDKLNDNEYLAVEDLAVSINKKQVDVTFKYRQEPINNGGFYNYGVYADVFVNNRKINDSSITVYLTDKESDIKNYVSNKFSHENLVVLKSDEEYIVFNYEYLNETSPASKSLLIVDERGSVVLNYGFNASIIVLKDSEKKVKYGDNMFYVDGEYLYYLDWEDDENSIEYKVTINNSKIEHVSQTLYEMELAAGLE